MVLGLVACVAPLLQRIEGHQQPSARKAPRFANLRFNTVQWSLVQCSAGHRRGERRRTMRSHRKDLLWRASGR